MDSQGPSRLDSLPTEISHQIMEELLTLHKTDGIITELPERICGFRPAIQPQVLRVSKMMHKLGKSVLNRSNKWVVLDMDYAHLLTTWASTFIEMIIVDPESDQDLPDGMLHIRIKPFARASAGALFWDAFLPKAVPQRQLILVPVNRLSSLVSALRMVDLAHMIRMLPGVTYRNRNTREEYILNRGEHGLRICIHVNEGYPRSLITESLDHFRMLHGPLHELSIVGALDEQQLWRARSIEASISAPRDVANESTFSELIMHIMDLIALNEVKSREGLEVCVLRFHEQARTMVINTHNNDTTPWDGWVSETTAADMHFEMLVLCASSVHFKVHQLLISSDWAFTNADGHESLESDVFVLEDGIQTQLKAYIILVHGLHYTFSSWVPDGDYWDMSNVVHGLGIVMESKLYTDQMPYNETALFRKAYEMHDKVLECGLTDDTVDIVMAIVAEFAPWFSTYFKPIKFRVHESSVPETLQKKGALDKMKKESLLTDDERGQYLIVETFELEEETKGDFYLL